MIGALLLLSACGSAGSLLSDKAGGGGDTAPVGCFDVPAAVAVGGSELDAEGRPLWVAMPEGSAQTMVHGPQGGWHLLVSADTDHTEDIVTLDVSVLWPAHDDALLSYGSFKVMLVPHEDDCGGTFAGMLAILDVTALAEGDRDTPPELLAGETVLVRIDATDVDGRTARDEVSVVAALDPVDEPDGDSADTGP